MSLIKKPSELAVNPAMTALIYGQPGLGKAQPVTSRILTPDGFKELGSIRPGDVVVGRDGKPQTILGVFPQGVRPVYEITTNDCAVCECDEEHIWTVRYSSGNRRKAGWRNMTLKEMLEKGVFAPSSELREASGRQPVPNFEIPLADACDFPEREFGVAPYVLGVLLGDGCLTGNVACFSTPDCDAEIALKVESLLPDGYYLKKRTEPACPQYLIEREGHVKGEGFINKTGELGANVLSGDKFIPYDYFLGSIEQRKELLRGLMDTDGSASANRVWFYSTSPRLALQVADLVRSLGGMAHVAISECTAKSILYRVTIRVKFNPFSLERKAAQWKESHNRLGRYIVNARRIEDKECVCVKVSNPDELYITDGFIVTHNTTLACSAPDPVLFDFDGGVHRMHAYHQPPTVQVRSWEDAIAALEEVRQSGQFRSIVIDTAGKMLAYMEEYIKRTQPKFADRSGSLTLKGYGARKQMFIDFNNAVRLTGRNVVYVAHEIEQKRGDDTIIRPEIGGSSSNDLIKELDLVGYMEAYNKQRVITFEPCEKFYAKNTVNLFGPQAIPVLINEQGQAVGQNDYLAQVIANYQARLKSAQEQTAKFESLCAEIRERVEEVQNAKDANTFCEWAAGLEQVYNSRQYAGQAISAKARSLGLTYDKVAKAYKDGSAA